MRGRTAASLSGIVMDTEESGRQPKAKDIVASAVDTHIGQRIKARRDLIHMSREALGLRTALAPDRIELVEMGSTRVEAMELHNIADALGVPIHFFFKPIPIVAVPESKCWLRDVERWFGANLSPYERDFLGLARRLTGDIEAARDIVHDAYAKVLAGDTWSTLTHPRAYVMRIVYNLGLNKLRHARVVPMQQYGKTETVSYADLAPDAFETLSSRQEIQRLMDAIARLPPQCRKVITLRKIEEMRPGQIAERLGISLSMVEKHLARGLVLLAGYLDVASVETTPKPTGQITISKPE